MKMELSPKILGKLGLKIFREHVDASIRNNSTLQAKYRRYNSDTNYAPHDEGVSPTLKD